MEFSAKQIAGMINGAITGNEHATISGLARIEEGTPGTLSFLANPLYTQYIYTTKASIVIVNKDFVPSAPIQSTLIAVDNAAASFAKLLEAYNQIKLNKSGISAQAFISDKATIGENIYAGEFAVICDNVKIGNNVKIYPQVYIGENVTIGDNTTLFAGVKIYSDCHIGKDCIVHSGTVIGSDGFRFTPETGTNTKVPQIGDVVIEDDVELGANCTVDRATLGSTILRKGVKLDNMIHIAHNVEVGENTYMAACCVIAGSTKIGKNCMLSGQVGVNGHMVVADGTKVAAQSGISKSITRPNGVYMGSPAFESSKYRKAYIHFRNLEALVERVEKLEKELSKVEQ